jgi:hypothetical protein
LTGAERGRGRGERERERERERGEGDRERGRGREGAQQPLLPYRAVLAINQKPLVPDLAQPLARQCLLTWQLFGDLALLLTWHISPDQALVLDLEQQQQAAKYLRDLRPLPALDTVIDKARKPLLPRQPNTHAANAGDSAHPATRKTLVLDMDHTMVHTEECSYPEYIKVWQHPS